ncbi:MAG: HAD hydrolase family protein [Eubacterium sp.]
MAAVFFDIDGTLWDKDNIIPESTKSGIQKLKENGHSVFLCSGRTRIFITNEQLLTLGFDGILCGCGTHVGYHGRYSALP